MPQPPDNLARRLRGAVLANDHRKAERLTVEYTATLAEFWKTLSTAERAASSLPQQSLELLTWVREMTLMQQAMTAVHLSALERNSRQLTARALYLRLAAFEAQP